jgi:hypothetical protein
MGKTKTLEPERIAKITLLAVAADYVDSLHSNKMTWRDYWRAVRDLVYEQQSHTR